MLSPVAALPLLLAATLDAPPVAAPARPTVDSYAAEYERRTEAPPAPTIESSPRLPEPSLRRSGYAEGSDQARAGQPGATDSNLASPAARRVGEGRVQRLRTRGPPQRES
jgi:hypothetical protein